MLLPVGDGVGAAVTAGTLVPYGDGRTVGADVAAGVPSVGVGGKGIVGVGMSLMPLGRCVGLLTGETGVAGDVPEGQRPHVPAQ